MIKYATIEHDVSPLLPLLVRVLEEDPEILFAYLFGSRAHGRVSPLSDVDIAVYLSEDCAEPRRHDKALELAGKAEDCLGTSEVDLVVLNDAPPELAYSVLSKGKLLVNKDDLALVRFRVATLREYLDRAHMRDIYERYLLRRLKEGKFGV